MHYSEATPHATPPLERGTPYPYGQNMQKRSRTANNAPKTDSNEHLSVFRPAYGRKKNESNMNKPSPRNGLKTQGNA